MDRVGQMTGGRSEIQAAFRGQKVIVTGDTGFKGSWLSFWLAEMGAEVLGIALPVESEQHHFALLELEKCINHCDIDIRDHNLLSKTIKSFAPTYLFHLAAQPLVRESYADPKLTFDTNVGGSVNVLEAVRDCPTLRSVVFVTSDKCYRNNEWVWGYRETDELGGADPYSASKAAAEMVLAAYQKSFFERRDELGVASARAGNVIGGGDWSKDRIVPDCVRALMGDLPIILRSPNATRPWQHVLDPLFGYLQLAVRLFHSPKEFTGAWNFGPSSNSVHTVRTVADGLISHWGKGRLEINADPLKLHEASLLHLAIDKARIKLAWEPTWDFARSIEETAQWYRGFADGIPTKVLTRAQIQAFMEMQP